MINRNKPVVCVGAFLLLGLAPAQSLEVDADYQHQATSLATASQQLSATIEDIAQQNQEFMSAGMTPRFTREMQAQLLAVGRSMVTALSVSVLYSEALWPRASEPQRCGDGIARIKARVHEYELALTQFAQLDVEGDDAAEAAAAMAGEFSGLSALSGHAIIEMLGVCSLIAADT